MERFEGDSPIVRFTRGATTLISDRFADSMDDLQKAIRLWYGIATMFNGDYEAAIEAYDSADKLPLLQPLLQLTGSNAEAQAIFDNLQLSVLSEKVLIGIGDWMLMDDRPEDFIAYVQKPGSTKLARTPVTSADHLYGRGELRGDGSGEVQTRIGF